MNLYYVLRCTHCDSVSEPQPGTPPGPYTTRVCGDCLVPRRCAVLRFGEPEGLAKVAK